MAVSRQTKELVTSRFSTAVMEEVRRLAEREGETQSHILRKLLRLGLDAERRNVQANQ